MSQRGSGTSSPALSATFPGTGGAKLAATPAKQTSQACSIQWQVCESIMIGAAGLISADSVRQMNWIRDRRKSDLSEDKSVQIDRRSQTDLGDNPT